MTLDWHNTEEEGGREGKHTTNTLNGDLGLMRKKQKPGWRDRGSSTGYGTTMSCGNGIQATNFHLVMALGIGGAITAAALYSSGIGAVALILIMTAYGEPCCDCPYYNDRPKEERRLPDEN